MKTGRERGHRGLSERERWDVAAAYALRMLDGPIARDHEPFLIALRACVGGGAPYAVVAAAAMVWDTWAEPGPARECARAHLRRVCRDAGAGLQLRLDVDPAPQITGLLS